MTHGFHSAASLSSPDTVFLCTLQTRSAKNVANSCFSIHFGFALFAIVSSEEVVAMARQAPRAPVLPVAPPVLSPAPAPAPALASVLPVIIVDLAVMTVIFGAPAILSAQAVCAVEDLKVDRQ